MTLGPSMLGFVLVRIVAACSSATSFAVAVLPLVFLVVTVALAELAGPSNSIKNDDKRVTSVSLRVELDPANNTCSVVLVVDLPAPFPGAPERISRSRYDVEVPMLEDEEDEEDEDEEEIPMLEDGGTFDDEPLVEHHVHHAAVVFVDDPTLPRAWQQ